MHSNVCFVSPTIQNLEDIQFITQCTIMLTEKKQQIITTEKLETGKLQLIK